MDDLVVIILTLLVAGAGIIGQLKKKKQISEGTGEQKKDGDIWDLLKEEVFPQEKVEPPVPVNIEQEEFKPYENKQDYKFKAKNESGKRKDDYKIPETKKINTGKRIKEDFSLRKAVIYSEILNRKYK
jgi:hypothetical protein